MACLGAALAAFDGLTYGDEWNEVGWYHESMTLESTTIGLDLQAKHGTLHSYGKDPADICDALSTPSRTLVIPYYRQRISLLRNDGNSGTAVLRIFKGARLTDR